jgi:hypothetical protein
MSDKNCGAPEAVFAFKLDGKIAIAHYFGEPTRSDCGKEEQLCWRIPIDECTLKVTCEEPKKGLELPGQEHNIDFARFIAGKQERPIEIVSGINEHGGLQVHGSLIFMVGNARVSHKCWVERVPHTHDEARLVEHATERGMDMSQPGAQTRWREIFNWVYAKLAPDNTRDFGACSPAPDEWGAKSPEERLEEKFIRSLLLAKTAEDIGLACFPDFLIAGVASQDDEKKFGAVGIEEAFRGLARSLNLTDAEAQQAREIADRLIQKNHNRLTGDPLIFVCARKYNIIKQAVDTAKNLALLADKKEFAKQVLAEKASATKEAIRRRVHDARSKSGKGNRKVQDAGDRAKIIAAVKRKIGKSGIEISRHQAACQVAKLTAYETEKDNLLELKHGPYYLKPDAVKNMMGWKKPKP